ncbi:hypothetical protein [Flavobacterium phragmitis]|uniref:Uncharacterized protein n=1 Tax=Flavobacterium phragmitis TaxID=739143 RepID=A0A1I1QPH4_9FLAO|nr:hypothetical protein [Flavobacterium phragmitis]SFD21183.1 hypothetical protein SAMN05216297_105289 [Flavobacterium phragmitis]
MKLKLHFLFLFTVLGLHAQKQIQPYNYSVTDPDNDKTETIMIYAAASSVNNLTFTLKNAKDEVLINNDDKEISFQVFPFTEVSFGKHLTDAINSIKPKENDAENTYEIIKKRITNLSDNPTSQKQKIAVQDVRNIYQFFNALVITAFVYDTEPVAGVLKYTLNTTIAKKNIEGQNADLYFLKSAKHLRKHIIYDADANCKKEPFKLIEKVCEDPKSLQLFKDFYENTKGPNTYKAKVKFKHYAEKKLKELYNVYELEGLIKGEIFSDYVLNKTQLIKLNKELDLLKASKTDIENLIKALKQTLESDELKLKELKEFKDNLILSRSEEKENSTLIAQIEQKIDLYNKNLKTEESKTTDSIKINKIKQELALLEGDLVSYKLEKKNIENRINTLINDQKSKSLIDIAKFDKNITEKKNEIASLNLVKSKEEEKIKGQNALIKIKQNEIDYCISLEKDEMKKFPLWNFEIESIEVDINDGFIEHMTALGKVKLPVIDESLIRKVCQIPEGTESTLKEMLENFYNERMVKEIFNNIIGKELKFENEFPIGFSSKSDFADLHKYNLYAFEGAEKIFSLPVTNVITLYVQRHQNDRLDFSPKDQVVSLPSDDFARSNAVELKKETSSKILSLNIYSDFLGLKEGNPNGLLQFEVEKNIPLWTKRMVLGVGRSSNLGLVNYINFNLTWAKIGDENRQLQVKYADRYVNNEYRPDRYVTFLDMIKYENTSVGADLNIASFDFPLLKARIELNAGIHYGRVNVVDTLATDVTKRFDKNVNLIRAYPDFILRIRPEERFGAYLRFRPFKTIVPNNEEFYTVSSENDFVNEQKLTSKWLHRFELGTYYAPSPKGDNKFFFRYRYTNTSDWETNGYGEFQVGYLVYLKF